MSRRSSREDLQRLWWERTFKEREELLRERFGETEPPGCVMAFSWDDPELVIPGACSLCFRPSPPERPHWLYLTHGLAQPLEPEPPVPDRWSGYGCEFGILTNAESPWAFGALYQLMTYIKSNEAAIGIGHRVPMTFFGDHTQGVVRPELGLVPEDGPSPRGMMRALLFWPYMDEPKPLWTSTGYFDILVGVAITGEEWEMARETSSVHVLYLLTRTGVGQVSDPGRPTITDEARWSYEWETIRQLPQEEVEQRLGTMGRLPGAPPQS